MIFLTQLDGQVLPDVEYLIYADGDDLKFSV
jgi:hypothetical protein